MSAMRYESLLQAEQEKCVDALLTIRTHDPAVAALQAQYKAFGVALSRFKEANRIDDDGDMA